jgi:NAD(P)-dependent dehydrogenase (short-subunit alcohol dehydrogenase family)
VLACRNVEKGEATKEQILSTGRKGAESEVLVFPADMASFTSVAAFANQCKQLPRVDAAILNAGVYLNKFTLSEGYETTMTVNVISTFLLVTLLLPVMQQSSSKYHIMPNIAVVGSVVHFFAKTQDLTKPATGDIFHSLSDPEKTKMTADRYNLSKLPVMLMVRHISKLLNESAKVSPGSKPLVVVNNVAPGFCKTGLFRNGGFAMTMGAKVMARSARLGARTLVHAAVAGKETHGQHLSECQVKKGAKRQSDYGS